MSGIDFFRFLVAEWELFLGIWLLSRVKSAASHFCAICTFTIFAAVTAWGTWAGNESCSCMGLLAVPPAWMLATDLIILGSLIVALPDYGAVEPEHFHTQRSRA